MDAANKKNSKFGYIIFPLKQTKQKEKTFNTFTGVYVCVSISGEII